MEEITFFQAFVRFVILCVVLGMLVLVLGMRVPRTFSPNAFPFRAFAFEKQGMLYKKLGILRWKKLLPDASRFVNSMTRKSLSRDHSVQALERLIQETCIAELSHDVLIVLVLMAFLFIPAGWCSLFVGIYALGNVPFIIIQRYNRPRLMKTVEMMKRRQTGE